jgi:hypothetical protein
MATFVITHPGCDAKWTGTVLEHCVGCHLTFGGTRAGDAHRVGRHGVTTGKYRRRCLTMDQMRAKRRKDGESWFSVRQNVYGTDVWTENRPDTRWEPFQDGRDGLEPRPRSPRTRKGGQAV